MAIYQAKFLSPSNTAIDGTLANIFSCVLQGTTITKYNAKAYNNSTGTQVYTTGDVVLSPVRYNNDFLSFTVPLNTFTNGIEYKWEITTFEGSASATSIQVVFKANATASLTSTTPSSITSQSYTFAFTYSQAQNIPINYWYMEFRDSNNDLLLRTENQYNGNITYKYSGFASGESYSVKCIVVNTNGVEVQSPIYNFSVTYARPNINVVPTIIQDAFSSIINVIWGAVTIITGVLNGTSTYIQNYGIANNWALNLNSNSYVDFSLNIPNNFTAIVPVKHNVGFTNGVICELNGANGSYYIGYDNTLGKYYFNNKGIIGYSQALPLPTTDYILFVRSTDAFVKINNIMYRISSE